MKRKIAGIGITLLAAAAVVLGGSTAANAATFNFGYHACASGYSNYTSAHGTGTATHVWAHTAGSDITYTNHGSGSAKTLNAYSTYRVLNTGTSVSGSGITSANRACYDS